MKKALATIGLSVLLAGSFITEAEASVRESIYGDLSLQNRFYEALYSMNMKEVVEADYTEDGKVLINPTDVVTRGDAAFMLYMLLGMEPDTTTSFPDVPSASPYYEAVSTVASRGIVNGFVDGSFRPESELTRAQMSLILAGAFEYSLNANATVPFTDINSRWAPYVDAMFRNGVTAGVTPTSFAPNKPLTRGEMSAFMYRAYTKVPGTEYNDFEVMNTVNEATRKSRIVVTQGLEQFFPKQQASNISVELSELAVDPYLSQALSGYETSCYYCDGANVLPDFDFGLPFKVVAKNDSVLRVDATVPSNSINSGYRAIIELVRSGDAWKIKSYTTRSFKEDPLRLTIGQASDYLTYAIPLHYQEEVTSIKHTGKESRTGLDVFLVNGTDSYVFDVNTGELSQYVPVN